MSASYKSLQSPFIDFEEILDCEGRFELGTLVSTGTQSKIFKAFDKENGK